MGDAEVTDRQQSLIESAMQQLDVTYGEADCILRAYLFNLEKACEDWYSDREATRKKVGVLVPLPAKGQPAAVQCSTAMCDKVPLSEASALGCGHWFCNDCWTGFLLSQINGGPECIYATCPGYSCKTSRCRHRLEDNCKCQLLVPGEMFTKYLKNSHAEEYRKYSKWLRDTFMENNKQMRWCPRVGCDYVVEYKKDNPWREITCKCGHMFCFKCGLDAHLPVPCDLATRFLALDTTDALTANLIKAITKPCPKCKVPIQKNEACIHMNCAKCGHQFCWLCKGNWTGHAAGYYSCKKYNEQKEKGELSDEQKAIISNQKQLQKYNLYRESYNRHQKSVSENAKFITKVENTSANAEKSKFLVDSVKQLASGHRLLQWSYCLSYFLKDSKEKKLFLYQQDQLQHLAKELHDFLVGKDVETLCEHREFIVNRARTVEKYRKSTLDALDQGQLINVIMNEADHNNDEWACTRCGTVCKDPTATKCTACSACRLHGEKQCWGCNPRT